MYLSREAIGGLEEKIQLSLLESYQNSGLTPFIDLTVERETKMFG